MEGSDSGYLATLRWQPLTLIGCVYVSGLEHAQCFKIDSVRKLYNFEFVEYLGNFKEMSAQGAINTRYPARKLGLYKMLFAHTQLRGLIKGYRLQA